MSEDEFKRQGVSSSIQDLRGSHIDLNAAFGAVVWSNDAPEFQSHRQAWT
jgi:hypothetical protein